MRSLRSIALAISNTKPGPCLHCCHFDRCASERMACRDFQRYTNFKPLQRVDVDRYPNAKIYDYVFNREDKPDGSMF
jgi:hypothetical protein